MRLRSLFLLVGLGLCPTLSYAITCSITGSSAVNFGTVNPLSTSAATTNVSLNYSCTRTLLDGLLTAATLCFNIGASANSGQVSTRTLAYSGPPASTLSYQLNTNAANTVVWGSQNQAGTSPVIVNLGSLNVGTPVTGSLIVYGALSTPQITAAPGTYIDTYSAATANLTANTGLLLPPGTCGSTVVATFPFTVLATVAKQCTITTNGNINLGSVNSSAVNTTSSNTLSVTCTNSTPYTVGLLPANGNSAGSGVMSGTGSNTDQVSYQLTSTAGSSGTVWGNTASNNVSGTGTGSAATYTVYATVPNANYTPDNYSDTVTVNVTY